MQRTVQYDINNHLHPLRTYSIVSYQLYHHYY